jgi:hypothetical protein
MFYYTVHLNWEWVFERALGELGLCTERAACSRELPSHIRGESTYGYALFRLECGLVGMEATSQIFCDVDRKDSLYRHIVSSTHTSNEGTNTIMPETILLTWDAKNCPELPSVPCLLKSSIGSGGWGIYVVHTPSDVNAIIKASAISARSTSGFLQGLKRTYGSIPDWCLQRLINSVRVKGNCKDDDNFMKKKKRKPQIRAYLFYCDGKMFLYDSFEVRLPVWEEGETDKEGEGNIDSTLDSEMKLELSFCANTNAVPYNYGRNKAKTERLVLDEISELNIAPIKTKIVEVMTRLGRVICDNHVNLLTNQALEQKQNNGSGSLVECAIAGVDLMIDTSSDGGIYTPHIVELNNNPAMPKADKLMSEKYRQHLVGFMSDIVCLGMNISQTKQSRNGTSSSNIMNNNNNNNNSDDTQNMWGIDTSDKVECNRALIKAKKYNFHLVMDKTKELKEMLERMKPDDKEMQIEQKGNRELKRQQCDVDAPAIMRTSLLYSCLILTLLLGITSLVRLKILFANSNSNNTFKVDS